MLCFIFSRQYNIEEGFFDILQYHRNDVFTLAVSRTFYTAPE